MTDEERPRIVVGVDGSEPSKDALRWAVQQARLVGGSVDAVITWAYPSTYYGWIPETTIETFDHQAEATLAKTVAEAVGGEPAVEIRQRVLRGDPATMVLGAADGAALLVVGNRGHGAFVGALLGSVSYRCVHHATCPVVVVRSGR